MRGDLFETKAADVCRTLAVDGRSGTLVIDGPDGPGGISFRRGRLVGATSPVPGARLGDRLVGAGYLDEGSLEEVLQRQRSSHEQVRLGGLLVEQGLVPRDAVRLFLQEQVLDALFEVLSWRYGGFEFHEGHEPLVTELPLELPVDQALTEVARRQQEWQELAQVIPDLDAVPSFRAGGSTDVALEPDEFAVLASIDGYRTVRDIASDLGYGEFEAARLVYGLVLLDIVEVRLPEDEIGAALEDAMAYAEARDLEASWETMPEMREADAVEAADQAPDEDPEAADQAPDEGPEAADAAPEATDEPEPPGAREAAAPDATEPEAADGTTEAEARPSPEPEATELDVELDVAFEREPEAGSGQAHGADRTDEVDHVPSREPVSEPEPFFVAAVETNVSEELVVDADLRVNDLRQVLAELGSLGSDAKPTTADMPTAEPAAQPPVDTSATDTTDSDQATSPPPTDDSGIVVGPPARDQPPGAVPPHRPADGADVSEFLRELSRLALDTDEEPSSSGATEPRRPSPSPPERRSGSGSAATNDDTRRKTSDDTKRKRRGLFGRGG